jgi:acetyl esterase
VDAIKSGKNITLAIYFYLKQFAKNFKLFANIIAIYYLNVLNKGSIMKPILEKRTAQFIEEVAASGGKPLSKLTVQEARKVLDDLQAKPVEKLPVLIEDLLIPTGPEGRMSIRIVRPQDSNGHLPAIMYFHGGGWILGNKETHDRLIREIACGSNAAVVFVNYSPSPEAKYPVPIEEAYAATKYVAEHGKELKLDSTRLAVAGDSVGGNMAAVVTLLAKERHGPKIAYQVLFYPVTDANFNTRSYQDFAEGPWLSKASMEWFWNAYAPNLSDRKKHTVCPLLATPDQLHNLPPALIITDENDVLRDEGEAYAHKLIQAGVEVTTMRCLGTCHDFLMLNPLCKTPAARSVIAIANAQLQKAFMQKKKAKQAKVA